jgi:DNA-binding SARP family transcriptional activator
LETNERWRLRVAGADPDLYDGDEKVDLSPRSGLLLAYLALAGPTPRAQMAALLWPDRGEARARGNLRQLLHRLGRHGELVAGDPLRLHPTVRLEAPWTGDVAHEGGSIALGLGLDPDRFGALASFFATEHARRMAEALAEQEAAWGAAAAAGSWDRALAAAQRAMAIDPTAERPYRLAMTALIELGLPQDALATYGRGRQVLAQAFDAEPADDTRAIAERAAGLVARARGGVLEPVATVARRARAGGWVTEGIALLRTAVDAARDPAVAGRRRVELAWLLHQTGDGAAAERAALEAMPLLESAGDATGAAECGFVLGSLARFRGDVATARAWWARALATPDVAEGAAERMLVHLNVAMVEDALDDAAAAQGHYLAALELARTTGDRSVEATVLNNLAHAALAADQAASARTLARAAHAAAAAVGDRLLLGCVLDGLARVEIACGNVADGRAWAARAYLIAREDLDPALQVDALVTLSTASLRSGEPEAAADLATAALRAAARADYLPGAGDAAAALAEAWGRDDRRAAPLLAAVCADPRVRRGAAGHAARLLAAWGGQQGEAPAFMAVVAAVLGAAVTPA